MKLLFFIMALSAVMYFPFLLIIRPKVESVPGELKMGLEGSALVSVLIVLFIRFVKIAGVLVPDMPITTVERLAKLRTYFIVCYVFCETVALYGFVLRFMGSSLMDAAPFFAGSLLLYALCYPRLPSDLDSSQG